MDTLRAEKELLTRNRRRRIWQKAVSALACAVVFCTTYALILPAITMEKPPLCGKEEHTHTEDCYTPAAGAPVTVPVCTPESLGLHTHTPDCYNAAGELVCGYADFVVHIHDASCYDGTGALWCPLPEIAPHTHTESCWAVPEAEPAHVHTDECYAVEQGELICTVPEGDGGHTHGEDCFDENSQPVCTLEETPGHQHTEECFAQNKVLVCELSTEPAETAAEPQLICGREEIVLHTHDASCFDESGALICGLVQVLEHVHGPECFSTEAAPADTETLTCTVPEGAGAHLHGEGCYDETGQLICQLEETSGHIHGPLCYGVWELTCGLEEHVHGPECYVDPEADLETAAVWEATLPGILPEKREEAVVEVALSQLGYRESERNYIVDPQGEAKGYTRYGQWYGDPYGDWDAMFAAFCLHYAGVPADAFPLEADCGLWAMRLQQPDCGLYRQRDGYAPRAGDLVFFDTDFNGAADHVGIVTALLTADNGAVQLRAVEGDADDGVRAADYGLDDLRIMGYGALPGREPTVLTWSQGDLTITATFPAEAALPANAQLAVEPLFLDNGMTPMLLGETDGGPAPPSDSLFRICVQADGEEINPQTQANVEVRFQEDPQVVKGSTELCQYSDDGVETVPLASDGAGGLTGSFDADLSEAYTLTSTVDFFVEAPPARAQDAGMDVTITPHKTIDAFRDSVDNPDTTLDDQDIDQTDLYRLYLDAQLSGFQQPVDLLIVVDQSGSMHQNYGSNYDAWGNIPVYSDDDPRCKNRDMTDDAGNAIFRDQAVRLVLNGTYNESDYEQKKQNGLIYQFLAANPENSVAVVGFQGDSAHNEYGKQYRYDRTGDNNTDANTILMWTKTPQYVNVEGKTANATNYCAGFLEAGRRLDDAEIASNGHKKVILFLSDGLPTCYIAEGQERVQVSQGYFEGLVWHPAEYEWRPFYYRDGNGQNEEDGTASATNSYFNELLNNHLGVTVHTISIRADAAVDRLNGMAKDGGGQCYSVSTTDELKRDLKKLMYGTIYSDLVIEDTLSEYVELYDSQPDFKVTMADENGVETVLYENNAATPAGQDIIGEVTYDPALKKVKVSFKADFNPRPSNSVTVSFNVKTSQAAYDYYAKNNGGYPESGDANTDYNGNATSSLQPGFYSNDSATLSYTKDGEAGSAPYPHPVVQAAACKVVIQKTDSTDPNLKLSGAVFDLYREAREGEVSVTLPGLEGNYVKLYDKTVTTDENGQAVISGLVPGDYWLVETKAPAGYRLLTDPIAFTLTRTTVNGQIVGSIQTLPSQPNPPEADVPEPAAPVGPTAATVTDEATGETLPVLTVPNAPWGHELPQTGGAGTIPYTTGGLLTVCVCGLLLYSKRRKTRGKEDFASS